MKTNKWCKTLLQYQMWLNPSDSDVFTFFIDAATYIVWDALCYKSPLPIYCSYCLFISTLLPFFLFKPPLLLPLSTLSLSLPGSVPSVCLWAGGAGCYLDDLVQEGEREFISCLPSGLCYLWYFNANLLNIEKEKKSHVHPWRSTAAQRVKVHPMHLARGSGPQSGCEALGLW